MGRPRTRMPNGELIIPESNVQSLIISFLKRARIMHNRVNGAQISVVGKNKRGTSSTRKIRCNSINGKADIEAWFTAKNSEGYKIGVMLYIEVKASHRGRQSVDQKDFERELVDRGYYYVLANSLQAVYDKMVWIKNDFESNVSGFILDIGKAKV